MSITLSTYRLLCVQLFVCLVLVFYYSFPLFSALVANKCVDAFQREREREMFYMHMYVVRSNQALSVNTVTCSTLRYR